MKILTDLSQLMSKLSFIASKVLMMSLAMVFLTTGLLAQSKPYWSSDRQISTILTRIETKTNTFQRQMQTALDRSTYNNTNTEDQVNGYINDFERATNTLKNNFGYKNSTDMDVQNLLQKAAFINNFMKTTRLNSATQTQWTSLRNDLNTLSRYYSVAWNWNSLPTTNPSAYSVPYATVQNTIVSLERNTNTYKNELDTALDRSSLNNTQSEDMINRYVSDFENSTNALRSKFQAGTSNSADVQAVLNNGYIIDGFMRDYQLSNRAENQWNIVRQNLTNLANYYSVAMSWNQTMPWNNQYDTGIDGTYRLNTSLSDNVNSVIQTVTTGQQNERAARNLQRRLASPEYLAIDKNGNSVTIASNGTGQATFQADGVARTETVGNRQVKVTGKTNYNSITLNYEADRMNDYYVSFMPMANGKLKVVRRVNLENRNESVAVASVYDKVNTVADFSWIARQGNNQNNQNATFNIPNGTQIQGTLNESLSTKTIKDGDRFSINVTSPSNYAGSTIYGYVSGVERSGRVSGRANMTLNFEQIRLRNGSTHEFRGIVENVTDSRGNKISVNNEGVARDGSQTNKTIVRGGIGAGLGAILGAIIGGGDGAAIGAVIGGGAVAGSVIAQGRDDLVLEQGSQVVISASAPVAIT
ncbi:MAG: hypothetical protein AAB336_02340, partial [Acidobacteriota bacterium]